MNRRYFIKALGLLGVNLSLPKLANANNYRIRILDQFNTMADLNSTISLPFGAYASVRNGIAEVPILYVRGDINHDGTLFGKDDLALGYRAAARVIHTDSVYADANADGKITANDALRFFKASNGDTSAVSQQLIAGQVYFIPVSLAGDETYLGVNKFPMQVEKDRILYIKVFKNGPVTEPYLARRYADARDLFGKLAGLEMQMVDKGAIIRRWQRIIIDYGQYTFANIDHAAIMRDEARRINEKIGLMLFVEGKNGNASIDYSQDRSSVAYTLYDAEGNPAKAIIYKKKYCGAENWSRAEAQRLLLSLAMGIDLDDQFFPDEHIAVEKQDARLPDEVWDALKAMYNLPIGLDIKVFDRGGEKPAIYVDGKAEINSPIKLVVVVPDGAGVPTLEYLIAEKTTREFWSAESADEQPKYQGPGLDGRSHVFTFQTEWPGPRRFITKVQKGSSINEALMDVPVKANIEHGYLKSTNLLAYLEFMKYDPDSYILNTLNRYQENGINMLALHPEWYLDDHTKTSIHAIYGFHESYRVSYTWPDELTIKVIKYAKDFGMKVMIRPNICILNALNGKSWQGELLPENNDWDSLFASHLNYLLHYARIGEKLAVEYMCIGAELNSMCLPNFRIWINNVGYPGCQDADLRWRHIISEVRKIFSGKLTLSLGSNQYGHENTVSDITFWDALDFIGIEPYFGLTGGTDPTNLGKNDPTLQEIAESFKYWAEKAFLPTLNKFGKKAIVTESNYYSFDGVNKNPCGVIGPRSQVIDWKEQADCYNVMIQYFLKGNMLEALNVWPGYLNHDWRILLTGSWDNFLKGIEFFEVLDFIYGKPAEKIIQANWKV